MGREARRGLLGLLLVSLGAGAAPGDGVAERLEEAASAEARGRFDLAREGFLAALALDPRSSPATSGLLRLDGGDATIAELWRHFAAAYPETTARGERAPNASDAARKLEELRKNALEALLEEAQKPRAELRAVWAFYLLAAARELALGTGRAIGLEERVQAIWSAARPDTAPVLDALVALARSKREDPRSLLPAARLVVGICRHRLAEDRADPAAAKLVEEATAMCDAARRALASAEGAPIAPEVFEEGGEFARREWDRTPADWNAPRVAYSPNRRYRIESVCGFETTRAVVRLVEVQHQRLARWYGKDPFLDRVGILRLCSSDADIEREGAPFYWARGFQRGDVTRVNATYVDEMELARLLTHELTHRFDGALRPGEPSWLVEGRAEFTASGVAAPASTAFEPHRLLEGHLWDVVRSDYLRTDALRDLLDGKLQAEYVANYPFGYSLFLFLREFRGFDPSQPDPPVFASRIDDFARAVRGPPPASKTSVAFTGVFCDDKGGRPRSLESFCDRFAKFVGGLVAWDPPEPWAIAFRRKLGEPATPPPPGPASERIVDRSNWPLRRERTAAPASGEGHAIDAAALLAREGLAAPARVAVEWALHVEEASPSPLRALAAALPSASDPAWMLRRLADALEPPAFATAEPVPEAVAAAMEPVAKFLAALDAAIGEHDRDGRPEAARVLRADAARIARRAGFPPPSPDAPLEAAAPTECEVPECHPPIAFQIAGVRSVEWSPWKAAPGAPFELAPGNVIELGRASSNPAATGVQRTARSNRVFVRGGLACTGAYSFRARVIARSAYYRAGVVVGWTRRDRGTVIEWSAGDYDFAIGHSKESGPTNRLHFAASDVRPAEDRPTPRGGSVERSEPVTSFRLRIDVVRDTIRVYVDGDRVFGFTRSTADPIEGFVGLALESGLVAFQEPTIQFHRGCAIGTPDE